MNSAKRLPQKPAKPAPGPATLAPRPVDALIFLLYLLYFRTAIAWIIETFLDAAFYEYGIAFVILLAVIVIALIRQRKILQPQVRFLFRKIPFAGLLLFLAIDATNTIFLHHFIISALAFLLGFYCLLGFYLPAKTWNRGIFAVLLLSMTLPFLVHIQTFLGFPLRILTAKIVSSLLQMLGIANVSDSTIIVTENNATSIDLPCSGVKSIYAGALFLFAVFYLKKARLSLQMVGVALVFFLSLVIFNIWRVFSLVYIYDVLKMEETADFIHIALGLGGFTASCLLLWYLTGKYVPAIKSNRNPKGVSAPKKREKWIVACVLLVFFIASEAISLQPQQVAIFEESPPKNFSMDLPSYSLQPVPFTQKEEGFFVNRDIKFSKKYQGLTGTGTPFSLLVVASASWKSHHNPEICLQGLGYHIESTEIYKTGDIAVRKVSLKESGSVIYWFAGKDKTIMDYSERVWEGMFNPGDTWALVEIGFAGPVEISNPEIRQTILDIQTEVQRGLRLSP